jgi:hypothetical protein
LTAERRSASLAGRSARSDQEESGAEKAERPNADVTKQFGPNPASQSLGKLSICVKGGGRTGVAASYRRVLLTFREREKSTTERG